MAGSARTVDSLQRANHPGIVAVVLDYSRGDLTEACLRKIRAQSDCPVVVVENGASSVARYAALASIEVIHNGRNLGFAGGVNVGLRRALSEGCSYVLLLNNDAWLAPGTVSTFLSVMERDPQLGIVAPARSGGILASRRPDDTRARLPEPNGSAGPDDAGRGLGGPRPMARQVRRTSAHCLLIRRSVFERIGLFDEDFFFLKEDDEFCERTRAHGFTIAQVSSVAVYHPGSASSNFRDCSSVGFLVHHVARSRVLLARKLRKRQLPQATMALYDTARLASRSVLQARVLCPSVVRQFVSGVRSGAVARLREPPRLSDESRHPAKGPSGGG